MDTNRTPANRPYRLACAFVASRRRILATEPETPERHVAAKRHARLAVALVDADALDLAHEMVDADDDRQDTRLQTNPR